MGDTMTDERKPYRLMSAAEKEAHMQRIREDNALIDSGHADQDGTSIVYVCQLCERQSRHLARTPADITAHITTTHGLTMDDIRAAKGQMAAHLDARDWFQTDDCFTLPDGRELLLRSMRMPRRGADKAMWTDETESKPRKRKTKR